jgi:hypothetical protein
MNYQTAKKNTGNIGFIILLFVFLSSTVFPWGSTGHRIINQKAPKHLPASLATLKADSSFYSSHASDADGRKNYSDTSFFAEAQRHYIDIDEYPNFQQLPHSLDSVIALYGRTTVRSIGTLPWVTVLVFDSLTAQFSRNDMTSAKQTMADLGHYVGDAHQPLHCTQNYNGQLTNNDGIHSRYETSMINSNQSSLVILLDSARYIASPLDYIFEYIYHSNSYTDSLMAADNYAKSVSGWDGNNSPPTAYYTALWARTQTYTKDQFQRATVALSSLWYTAWVNAQPEPPPVQYAIQANKVGNGTIFPFGTIQVNEGRDTTFTFTPATGSHLDSVVADGVNKGVISAYTYLNVHEAHSLTAYFSVNMYSIIASAGPNGTISPSGVLTFPYNSNQTYSIIPNEGYHVSSLLVDGVSITPDTSYSFLNISESHTLHAEFAINTYSITTNTNLHGIISPSGVQIVTYGESKSFTFTPDSGYHVDSVFVDGMYVDSTESYTFTNVTASHSLTVRFSNTFNTIFTVKEKWNIISVPMKMDNYSTTFLFPTASSGAFKFDNGYVQSDSLQFGKGYWLKFDSDQSIRIKGEIRTLDRITVHAGWNLLGSITSSVDVATISSIPEGIITSPIFGYDNGYNSAIQIEPGKGYWVKVNQSGWIVLSILAGK